MSAGKILVVDDEPQIRRVMRVILAGKNYEIMEARSGEAALLRFREFLRYLVSHAGKPVPHRELLQAVWGPDYGDQTDYLRVFITHLRKKIEPNPAKPQYILTEPWIGYRFGN